MVVLNLSAQIFKAFYLLLFVLFMYMQHFISMCTPSVCCRNDVVSKYYGKTHLSGYFLQKILTSQELVISAVYFVCDSCLCKMLVCTTQYTQKVLEILCTSTWPCPTSGYLLVWKARGKPHVKSEFSGSTDHFRDLEKGSLKHNLCWISTETLTGAAF